MFGVICNIYQHEEVASCRRLQRSIIGRLQTLAGLYQGTVFFIVIKTLAGYKCSLSMMTDDCPIDYTAQYNIRSTHSRGAE